MPQEVGPDVRFERLDLLHKAWLRCQICHFVRYVATFERGGGPFVVGMVGYDRAQIARYVRSHRGDIVGNGLPTKGGSAKMRISERHFENAGGRAVNIGASTGAENFCRGYANYEAKDVAVEDCTFICSMTPIASVGVDGADFQCGRWHIANDIPVWRDPLVLHPQAMTQ